ncbi:hypothetical protein CWI36_1795p0010 [Hamiltosporidium magnivora]|uniref:Uncharacterized protein n=2 Tax=Hamiltosporidium magnivora TaxID=148818 RepID=A0A4Q9KYA8_9MICR|nr:hypothetical protein CWI36_1795p0010 [Hamiltosporidium magnivora]
MVNIKKDIFNDINKYKEAINVEIKEISMKDESTIRDYYMNILESEDIYYIFYVLKISFLIKVKFVNRNILEKLNELLQMVSMTRNVIEIEYKKICLEFIKNHIINNDNIDIIITVLGHLDLNDHEIMYFRKFFGYSKIYNYYKNVNKMIFEKYFTTEELIVLIRLLDNHELCFVQLLPAITRINEYVTDSVVEKNIVSCCIILNSVILGSPKSFKDKDDYVISTISFLTNIFYDSKNFTFINLEDAKIILLTINNLTNSIKNNSRISNLSFGIYNESLEIYEQMTKGHTTVLEEYIVIGCLIKLIGIFYMVSYDIGCRMHDTDYLFNLIQDSDIEKPQYINDTEWKNIYDFFLSHKYETLDLIYPSTLEVIFKSDVLYLHLIKCSTPYDALLPLKNMLKEVDWSLLIALACSDKRSEYIRFLFNPVFFKNNATEHYEYIHIFIEAAFKNNDYDILLILTHILVENHKDLIKNEDFLSLYVNLFLSNFSHSVNFTISYRREKLLNFFCENVTDKNTNNLILAILDFLTKHKITTPTKYVFTLIFLYSSRTNDISNETVIKLKDYTFKCIQFHSTILTSEFDKYNEELYFNIISNPHIKLYIVMLSLYMVNFNMKIDFTDEDLISCDHILYIKLIISLICYKRGQFDESYLEDIRKVLLKFIINSRNSHVSTLGMLIKESDKSILIENTEKADILAFYDNILEKLQTCLKKEKCIK